MKSAILAAALGLGASAHAATILYVGTDMGVRPGGIRTMPLTMNSSGQVSGWSGSFANVGNHAFTFTPGAGLTSHVPPTMDASDAGGLSDNGWIAGHAAKTVGSFFGGIFRVPPGGPLQFIPGPIPSRNGEVVGVNNAGDLIGRWDAGQFNWQAFILRHDQNTITPMGTFQPGNAGSSTTIAINDLGQVAGNAHTVPGVGGAFRWTQATGKQSLGLRPGFPQTWATAMNASGQICGYVYDPDFFPRAFITTETPGGPVVQDIQSPGISHSEATAINDLGHVAGTFDQGPATHVFLYRPGQGMIDLGDFGTGETGLLGLTVIAINNRDQILMNLFDESKTIHPMLWSPGRGWIDLVETSLVEGQFHGAGSVAMNHRGDVALFVGGFETNSGKGWFLRSICTADLNFDNIVNTADLTIVLGSFGQSLARGSAGDINADGAVTTLDLAILLGEFGCGD